MKIVRRVLLGSAFLITLAGPIVLGTTATAADPKLSWGFEDSSQTGKRHTMPASISTLLKRNLDDVFGENDPVRRRAAIDEIYTEDVVFYESDRNIHRGRDAIDRVAGALRTQHPDFRYQVTVEPEEAGDGGRVQWVEGRPGDAPVVAGTDFIIVRDGRIAAIYFFFDKLPASRPR